ncbi:MAG: GGDEF domain-containing protein [Mycobacteriales bacterium]
MRDLGDVARRVVRTPHVRLWLKFFGAGVVVCQISLAILRPGIHDRLILGSVNVGVMLLIAAGTLILPVDSRITKLWPTLVTLGGLGVLGATTTGLSPTLTGFFVLNFVYVGLTQPAWTSLWLVAPAMASWLLISRPINETTLARVPVLLCLWVLLAELLSRVTTQQLADQERLAEQAARDALTGLRNRHGLEELITGAEVGDALVFLDLDNFKTVNDLLGHDVGDQVLADLGRIVLAVLRPNDIAVRYGGDELLLLLPGTPTDGAEALLRRMRRGWSASHPELTFSAGVAVVDRDGGTGAAKDADDALYIAKQRGRNRTEVAGRYPTVVIPGQSRPVETHRDWPTTAEPATSEHHS